ncbi:hypothetical protein PanWU01x14_134950 [Parasponia andersonii]|uniref:Uncharacterized protein n=1 Tax=Parasponia andersonii TaxID=3476 RepID=A0A2P5CP38_PARAD|nr:hypothetical protein PanWU01x14_134950 [Parasponia andersonii]
MALIASKEPDPISSIGQPRSIANRIASLIASNSLERTSKLNDHIEFQRPANKNRTIMISDCSTNASNNKIIISMNRCINIHFKTSKYDWLEMVGVQRGSSHNTACLLP